MKENPNLVGAESLATGALGSYRLVAEIGRGGMANVFLALGPTAQGSLRQVVIKLIQADLVQDEEFRAMFVDEARLAARLHHPNVVETFAAHVVGDSCFLVMEFLDGQPLSRVRRRARQANKMPLSIQLRVLAEVLSGLHYVHELTDDYGSPLGIVHRDVTPSNIFVTYDGQVKVVDFGIAKAASHLAETRIGVLKGKLSYMSPEAVRGQPIDRRSDIFSVGIMLWEAATGLRFWQDHDDIAIYRRLASGDLPLDPIGAQIPNPDLFHIAKRSLAVDPAERYATAAEMQEALEELLAQLGKSAGAAAIQAYMEAFFAVERENFQKVVSHGLARLRSGIAPRSLPSVKGLSDGSPSIGGSSLSRSSLSRPSLTRRGNAVPNAAAPSISKPAPRVADPVGESFPPSSFTFRNASTVYNVPADPTKIPEFRSGRHRVVYWGLAAATFAVGLAYVSHAPPSEPDVSSQKLATLAVSAPAVDPPVAIEPPAPPPAQTPTTSLILTARPREARFFLDGEPLEGNPAIVRKKRDDKIHRIRVEAPGYVMVVRTVDFQKDVARDFDLQRAPVRTGAQSRADERVETTNELPRPRRSKRPLDPEDPWAR